MAEEVKHLWEIDHPYYCSENNYFNNTCHSSFKSWQDYLYERGEEDLDMNLIFRWDWIIEPENYNADPYYRDGLFEIFYMGQRKGLSTSVFVEVCKNDEEKIKEFLKERWLKIKAIWEPLSD